MIKLIASDLDGTLLDSNGKLPKDFPSMFKKMKEHNVLFTAISGRPYYTLKVDFSDYINDMIFITDNGAQIIKNNEIIYKNIFEKEELMVLLQEYKKYNNLYIILCGTKAAYVDSNDEDFIKEASKYFYDIVYLDNIEEALEKDEILKVTFCDFKDAFKTYTYFNSFLSEKVQISLSGDIWIDIMDLNVSKGASLQRIQDKLAISKGETVVFGDYYNDVTMFSKGFYSYAMSTSPKEVQAKAKFVLEENPITVMNEILAKQFHP